MTSAASRVWTVDISTSPAARAGVKALLSADDSVRPWTPSDTSARAFGAVSLSDPQPNAPDVVIAVMATEAASLDAAMSRWQTAGLVMLGGDPELAYAAAPARPVALLGLQVEAAPLIAAVHAVAAGLTVVEPDLLDPERGIVTSLSRAGSDAARDVLTPRELQVLELVAAGLPNKAIAMELGISEHTAKFHVGSLLTKLDAASRTEAVTIAARRGILII